jgi:acetyl esterase/lipase
LAPEHPFPAACEDALAGYRFLVGSGFDPSRIVLAGDSSSVNHTLCPLTRARLGGAMQ